ncbi:MAG: 1-deoxy-D-xylulose-5-phosphate reductoisomerase, partial [Kiritimatiellae bacterium]|nr:1-deoxy-D-xylulose-5-phosphate reductoisomerase [Kiritimatiellia bacterium]
MRSVVVLGSTGSIGESTLAVADALPDAVRIVGLATRGKARMLIEQARRFGARVVAVEDSAAAREAERLAAPHGIEVWAGSEGVEALAALPEADTAVCALVG